MTIMFYSPVIEKMYKYLQNTEYLFFTSNLSMFLCNVILFSYIYIKILELNGATFLGGGSVNIEKFISPSL